MRAAVLALLLCAAAAPAQTLTLRLDGPADGGAPAIGDTLTLHIAADLGTLRVAGLALHLLLPARGLQPIAGPAGPFRPGLFAAGVTFANQAVAADPAFGLPVGAVLLTYAVVLGPGPDRFRSGRGAIAQIDVVCTGPVDGEIRLVDDPVHASKVVLDDGRTELGLVDGGSLHVTVGAVSARRTAGTWAALKLARR